MTSVGPAQNLADRMAATSGYHLATSCSRLEAGAHAAERAADAFSAAAGQAAAMQQPPGHFHIISYTSTPWSIKSGLCLHPSLPGRCCHFCRTSCAYRVRGFRRLLLANTFLNTFVTYAFPQVSTSSSVWEFSFEILK